MTHILLLGLVPLDQTLIERTTRIIRLLGSVANQKFFFNGVVQIAGLLEGADVNLQEGMQPPQLIDVFWSVDCLVTCNEHKLQVLAQTELFVH